MQTEHLPFPSDETLAAYIDGRLDEETRKRVVAHIAECAECLDVVMTSQEMADAADADARVVRFPRRAVAGIAAAAAVVIALLIVPLREHFWPRANVGALAAVAPPERVYDGRITGFPYRAPVRRTRGSGEEATQNPAFLDVAARVAKRAENHHDAETLRAQGVAELVLADREADRKAAARDLAEALQLDSGQSDVAKAIAASRNPQLLSDLAAAYIAANDQRARDAANRAWSLAHTPEIAWNRAMAAESFDSPADAIAKWRDYLAIDATSQWAEEAQNHVVRFTP